MIKILWFCSIVALLTIACQKTNEKPCLKAPENNDVTYTGQWISVAFTSGEKEWVADPMPHIWNFSDNGNTRSFSFRDHNGSVCTGEYNLITPINSYTQFDFLNQTCSLTSRVIDSFTPDTLILRVINPPNITKDKVKYARVR